MEEASLGAVRKPGDVCVAGGVYRVIHKEHRAAHTVVIRKDDPFPRCRTCGDAVRFRLVKKVAEHGGAKPARKRAAGQ